ncbi:alpha/beta hydrolase domain-containing protein [Fodinicola feengrottensis]|uniref:Alpha/beta hydrolase domain-containing protein n=2 Tax=Fodinicola feengrottensis TaxID=435914 RepID=A0ABP4RRU9_9ACTN
MGYVEEEYVIRGVSTTFRHGEDSEIDVGPQAAYVTRILVRTPAQFDRFNGTAVVEWLDATDSVDTAHEWAYTQPELVRGGFAWAGVSVQRAGVMDGLKGWDAQRYSCLHHPGDEYSYDMFSQAGRAIRAILPGVRLLAAGMSKSAHRLTTYVNKIDPIAEVFDGYLVHCRPTFAQPKVPHRADTVDDSGSVRFADVLRVPVLVLQTETEVASSGYGSVRQPDEECFRLWEIAGAARSDAYLQAMAPLHPLQRRPSDIISALASRAKMFGPGLNQFVTSGPQHHYVANAALHSLHRCLRDGVALPYGDRLATVAHAPHILRRDVRGNAVGGVRTPWVDVPTALLTGVGPQDGIPPEPTDLTAPFPAAMLKEIYPSADAYQTAFDAATDTAIENGVILQADAAEIKETASIVYLMSLNN